MRHGFTLLELLIAVTLFSTIMIYLYQSFATLQEGNDFYGKKLDQVSREQKILKMLYLDLALSEEKTVHILHKESDYDIVLMKTSNSIYNRVMPYVGYITNEYGLFRIESSQYLSYPLSGDEEMDIDELGLVKRLKIYRSKEYFLAEIELRSSRQKLFKVHGYNNADNNSSL
jgi:prepilin-type N-terminal cleavage/methylation domain-containing protein